MTVKAITYNPEKYRIELEFPYSNGLKEKVKAIPDARFDGDEKLWYLPPTKMHALFVASFAREYGFFIDAVTLKLSRNNHKVTKTSRTKLYPYQVEGLEFLHASGGRALLADHPGLGKTIQTLAYMEETAPAKVLIVSPASVTYMWKEKIKEWLGWDSEVIQGFTKDFNNKPRVLICSYPVFTNRVYMMRGFSFDLVIYDEIHYLKDMRSQRSRASRLLNAPNVIGLSGTPFLNRPKELFPILNLLLPTVWSSFWKFAHRYCDAKQDHFGHWDFDGADNLPELKEKLSHIMLRRTKQEVLKDLPPVTKNYFPYISETEKLVTQYFDALKLATEDTKSKSNSQRFMAVRQAIGMLKVEPGVELAEEVLNGGEKVVLFAIHKAVVAELEKKLKDYKMIKIVGDTPQKDRNDLVSTFLNDPDVRVAIISEAGGEGINLYSASTLIFVERSWSPGKEEQVYSRIHRIGQVNPVTVHYIIAKGTIDDRIHQIIQKKQEVLGQVINFDDIPVNDLLQVGE